MPAPRVLPLLLVDTLASACASSPEPGTGGYGEATTGAGRNDASSGGGDGERAGFVLPGGEACYAVAGDCDHRGDPPVEQER